MDRKALEGQINLNVALIPEGQPNRSGKQIPASHITIHNTSNDNKGANAEAHSKFVRNKGFYLLKSGKKQFVSWHFTVDDQQVIKHLPINERGIHAGDGNAVSIAIEICMHQGIDQEAANVRAAKLVAAIMFDLRIPKDNIKPHQFWTGKLCPVILLPQFKDFREMANRIFLETTGQKGQFEQLVTKSESAAVEMKRRATTEGREPLPDPVEEDPDEAHELIANEVNTFGD